MKKFVKFEFSIYGGSITARHSSSAWRQPNLAAWFPQSTERPCHPVRHWAVELAILKHRRRSHWSSSCESGTPRICFGVAFFEQLCNDKRLFVQYGNCNVLYIRIPVCMFNFGLLTYYRLLEVRTSHKKTYK